MIHKIRIQLKSNQKILAVSKMQPIEKIKQLYEIEQNDFAENYIQEALIKIESLRSLKIKWHLIGPIQSNKIKLLKDNFEYIHSVDSLKVARIISEQAEKINHIQKIFLQINISNETTKAGFSVLELKADWSLLSSLKNLKIIGLMTMPPLQNEPEQNRSLFKKLKNLAEKYALTELSMGTSHDYEVALQEGSTWIRLGTLLFGERSK